MTRQKLTVTAAAAAFALSLTPAWAFQDPKGNAGQAGSRPSGGASSTGSAAPRGGGSSGGSSGSSSSGSSAGSSSSSGSSTGSAGSSGSSGPTRGARAPERSPERSTDRRSGASTDRAVSRGTAGRNPDSANSSVSASDDRVPSRDREPVPAYSRPRDGRTPVGNAVERRNPLPGRGDGYYPSVIYDPYYSPYYRGGYGHGNQYSYWSPFGYGYGLGYFSYDPYLFGGYGYDPYGYGYGYDGYQGYRAAEQYRETGSLRLKVKPSDAQVLIDGYFVGVVDSFDGVFQRLGVDSGAHRVELRAEGYEPVVFEVMIIPGETVTYKGEMKRIR